MDLRPTEDEQDYARKVLLPWILIITILLLLITGLHFLPVFTLSLFAFVVFGGIVAILWQCFATTRENK